MNNCNVIQTRTVTPLILFLPSSLSSAKNSSHASKLMEYDSEYSYSEAVLVIADCLLVSPICRQSLSLHQRLTTLLAPSLHIWCKLSTSEKLHILPVSTFLNFNQVCLTLYRFCNPFLNCFDSNDPLVGNRKLWWFCGFMANPQWSDWSSPGVIELQSAPKVCSRSLCIRKWWAEFFRWIFIDIPPKLHNCGSRYALTWRESPERARAARAETPTQHIWHFAAILPRLLNCFLYSFSSFLSKIHWRWRSQLKFWR